MASDPFVFVLQHGDDEPLGTLGTALEQRGIGARHCRPFAQEAVPQEIGGAAGLIVLGGAMGVSDRDRLTFLNNEICLIENALAQNVPILGICLGAQLLAHTLGAAVRQADRQEIGWYPLSLTDAAASDQLWAYIPSPSQAFHWHGDTFDLPSGTALLASSALTPNQAFRFGSRVYGLQCHLEVTAAIIDGWMASAGNDLRKAGGDPELLRRQSRLELPGLQRTAEAVFGAWTKMLTVG